MDRKTRKNEYANEIATLLILVAFTLLGFIWLFIGSVKIFIKQTEPNSYVETETIIINNENDIQ